MENNYSYLTNSSSEPSKQSSAPDYMADSHIPRSVASPRPLQPLPPMMNTSSTYQNIQQSPYPQSSGYGNGYDYGQVQSPAYTHEPPLNLPSMAPPVTQSYGPTTMDTTGQVHPPGMRPRLTTSIFEEEGSICFQVDVDGICVARREDNHMINGTKLLNVARMTRGRRDGILKAEKQKTVVKIGPMHLKGVWIPYERALFLANQERITEQLYPLFVLNIGALLYHPHNTARPLPPAPSYMRQDELPGVHRLMDDPRQLRI